MDVEKMEKITYAFLINDNQQVIKENNTLRLKNKEDGT